ncbi:MAG: hypothetical protein ACOYB8_02415 [Eubacteriaceae bacterium]|jgi:cytoskeletal protein RodZ
MKLNMDTKKKKIAAIIIAVIIVGVAAFAIWRSTTTVQSTNSASSSQAPEKISEGVADTSGNTDSSSSDSQTDTTTDSSSKPTAEETRTATAADNTEAASEITVPGEMQTVIDENQANLNDSGVSSSLSASYPANLIPLYNASAVGDSNDVTTDSGKPGWTLTFGSDSSVDEIAAFYQSLLGSQSGYSSSTEGSSTKVSGSVSGYNVSITISPNNPQRTGLSYASDVTVFIEQQ